MRRSFRDDLKGSFIVSAGWLFADLLLALAMVFLAANTVGLRPPPITPTPTPTLVPTLTITPTPNDRILEHNFCRIQLDVGDPNTFINDDLNGARSAIEQQIIQVPFLKGRQVGIAIAYGGANDGGQNRGSSVAAQVYRVLKYLASTGTVFKSTSFYEPLFTGYEAPNVAIINVFLVAHTNTNNETCDANTHRPV